MTPQTIFIGTTLADNPVPHHFVALARELATRGHRVVLIAPLQRVDLVNPDSNPAIETWPSRRPTRLRDARFAAHLIRKYRPSCVVANFVAVNLMMVVGALMGVRTRIAWYHTLSTQLDIDEPTPRWKTRALRLRRRVVYRLATHLVPVSGAAAEDLVRVYGVLPSKVRVFGNALADPIQGSGEPGPKQAVRLICVARLSPSKGQDVLLRALARLARKHPALTLELVGVGPQEEFYRKLSAELGVADRCRFSGRLEHDEVLTRMRSAAVTVLPSRSEAAGLVTIESLAVGTPVIASAVGGIPEIVRDGVDGFLVAPEDPEALAEKIDRILSDADLRGEMSRNARRGFLERLEQKRAVTSQADWLESTLVARSLPGERVPAAAAREQAASVGREV